MNEPENAQPAPESDTKIDPGARVDPILAHLNLGELEASKEQFRDAFIKLWEYEEGDTLSPDEQYLTTVGVFLYIGHNILEDYNVRLDKARELLIDALKGWRKPELDKMTEAERSSDNPFLKFIENHQPEVDEIFTWRRFMLDHKKADEKEWNYKMKRCWFAEFFVHLGRTDYIESACQFDQIPWDARKDYVDLKLSNLFRKLGKFCQFVYTPAKK